MFLNRPSSHMQPLVRGGSLRRPYPVASKAGWSRTLGIRYDSVLRLAVRGESKLKEVAAGTQRK